MVRIRLAMGTILAITAALAASCGGGGGGGGAGGSGAIAFDRIQAPVLANNPTSRTFDDDEVDSPSVLVDANGTFAMWYEATDGGVNTIGLVADPSRNFEPPLATVRTQVIGVGASGTGADSVGATDPTVILDGPTFKMWYEGRSGASGTVSQIIYCESTNGVNWTNFAVCTGLTPHTNVSFGSARVADPTVVKDGSTYKMWFEAVESSPGGVDGPATIGYAESSDGINWTVKDAAGNVGAAAGPVFGPGAAGSFDDTSVNAPSVVIDGAAFPSEPFLLFYEAADDATSPETKIGLATSADGKSWTRRGVVLVPSSDAGGGFDSGDLEHPAIVVVGSLAPGSDGHFLLYYAADDATNSPNAIGLAVGRMAP